MGCSKIFIVTSPRSIKLSKPVNVNEHRSKQIEIVFKSDVHISNKIQDWFIYILIVAALNDFN